MSQNGSIGASVKNDLSSEYFTKKEIYETLISKARKKWAFFYDANSSVEISASITSVFSDIQTQLAKDGENISGLIDGNQVKNDLIERNRQIAELEKEINQLNRDMLTALRQAYQHTSWPTTAVTGTCIPFLFDREENMIITYLVCNSAYSKGNRFMFPGGHAFVNEESPEAVAIMKAKTEAGLDVKPIDLYFNFNNQSDKFSAQFTIYRPPHFTYLFEQNDSAKCYREKNHIRHYDAVYVCEILDIHPDTECSQARIAVKLPNKTLSLMQIKMIMESSIEQYNIQNQLEATEGESFGDYIAKMLVDAHIDYIKYLNHQGKEV